MPAHKQIVDDVLGEALALPTAERGEFLSRRCGDDAALRAEVAALLDAGARMGDDFLRPPPPHPGFDGLRPAEGPDPLVDATIGQYRVKSVIARGGMGTVYLAEQANVRRPVALKVLHAGSWSVAAARRFDVESQILGYLRHPNIAQVYEAGAHQLPTSATVRYFAMEYVPHARPLTRHADERSLNTRQRLELFLQVCDAVHHGHQKGVIHRDLKPANILVDVDGRVKVIDFGIARCTDSDLAVTTMHTEAGQIMGTLAYMSPEQCGGPRGTGVSPVIPADIDTRSDIYSLGIILFELLTGRMPYDVSHLTIYSAARVICDGPPARPSSLQAGGTGVSPAALRGNLDTIILKCLEKDAAKRYTSAAGLADDIRRHLNGEPISARPATEWTRAMHWIARHPKATTAAACLAMVGVSLAASYATVAWLNTQPDRVEVLPDQSAARVLSVTGHVVHTWPEDPKPGIGAVAFAQIIDLRSTFGRSRAAVVGYRAQSVNRDLAGRLCAYEMNGDLDKPIWQSRLTNDDLPQNVLDLKRDASASEPHNLLSVDELFPDSPGEEIVVSFCQGVHSQRAMRIYATNGDLLYQVWQDGSLDSGHWLPGPRLLVLAGLDEGIKERAIKNRPEVASPLGNLIFALRPKRGLISRRYVDREPFEGAAERVWVSYLHPLGTRDYDLRVEVSAPPANAASATLTQVNVFVTTPGGARAGAGLALLIDADGNEIPKSRVPSDEFRRLQGNNQLPPDSVFFLSDKPPI